MDTYNLRITGLSVETTERYLFHYLSSFNGVQLVSVRVCRDPTTRNSLGYGFINLASKQSADALIERLKEVRQIRNGCEDYTLTPSMKTDKTGRNLLVRNLPSYVSRNDIYNLFRRHGRVVSANLRGEGSRRIAYVLYGKARDAEYAQTAINGTAPFGSHVGYLDVRMHSEAKNPILIQD